jgi:hypothetical protein
MDVQAEIEFLRLLDNKVTEVAEDVAIIGPLQEVIAMIQSRIQQLQTGASPQV